MRKRGREDTGKENREKRVSWRENRKKNGRGNSMHKVGQGHGAALHGPEKPLQWEFC